MYKSRKALYSKIESDRNSHVISYFTSTRQGLEAQIHPEIMDMFADHLDEIGPCKKISLILHSNGGVTLTGWAIVNLIRMFCDEYEVIVPFKALSTATLIAIGANRIIMTKQATLGPIDPSTNGPYNPQFPQEGTGNTQPVSVEHVAGFFDLAKEHSKIDINIAFQSLCQRVHPLALGNVFRARNQIKMLATRLLEHHMTDQDVVKKVTAFLCSESGSHDYTINRREAQNLLGLPAEKPTAETYETVKSIYKDFSQEMKFTEPFSPAAELSGKTKANYELVRAAIESVKGGSHRHLTRGTYTKSVIKQQVGASVIDVDHILDNQTEQGWFHENP